MTRFGRMAALPVIALLAGAAVSGPGPAAAEPLGRCDGGEFRWTAADGAITMTPQWLTFTSAGTLRDCAGVVPGITGGTFTGVHTAWSDCMHPADGPITLAITWSDGETSTVAGPWPVAMAQPTTGTLEVTDGLGRGRRARITVAYDMVTPETVGGCLGAGVRTGTGRILGTMFE
ncbi:hypothetical protein IU500_35195 [Nocardia terpenica]|uniref:hypothetical protein n=1 Tax=Nocardia terpenica TaxID=455432 RepID=UPI001893D507|nr:hypothetical protein [Nocardia terpenica]MBF6066162.1 hypothetical protein [Nocardia terpenica]MBF6109262.1 hypothetical protein [Nocardia terpenica]MBF6116432.1 hypothetical protein [Nocardia terpenica]MBF6123563.1 hypothetical protein [Nocardia terpenica]MBF6156865.1 hypothetical protein [Nocardia terpenica]